jgi:hypothetical protein
MKIASFDIGLKTCSVAVETYPDTTELKPPTVKYVKNGEATDPMKTFVNDVGKLGVINHLEKRELGDKKSYFAGAAFHNLYAWVKEMDSFIRDVDIVLIEQQMKINNIALALMHHLHAYLLIHYPQKKVVLYPSKNKTRVLGAPLKVEKPVGAKGDKKKSAIATLTEMKQQEEQTLPKTKLTKVTKYQRKKWSTDCANQLLQDRKDERWHTYIFQTNKSKKDDLSDVIMQTLSYMVTKYLSL